MAKQNTIFVTFQKEGIHRYEAAANDPNLATGDQYDVSFLAYPHRHNFFFRVELEVSHTNREVEFIQFKRWLLSLYSEGTLLLDYKSCEMMADDLAGHILLRYPNRSLVIEVSEDNENGCRMYY